MARKRGESIFLKHLKGDIKGSKILIPEKKKSTVSRIRNKIEERVMLPRDVLRLFHITHNQLVQWEELNVRFSSKKHPNDRGWRRFSIADLMYFAILSLVRDLGISLTKNKRVIDWMRSINLVDAVIEPFIQGKKMGIYFNRMDIEGIYVSGTDLEKSFLEKIDKTLMPMVYIPLYGLFFWILKEASRSDFYLRIQKNGIMFYVDKEKVILDEIPTPPKRGERSK